MGLVSKLLGFRDFGRIRMVKQPLLSVHECIRTRRALAIDLQL